MSSAPAALGAHDASAGDAGAADRPPSAWTATYHLSYLGADIATATLRLAQSGAGPRRIALEVTPRQLGGVVNAFSGGALRVAYTAQLHTDGQDRVLPRRLVADTQKRTVTYRYTGTGQLAAIDVTPEADRQRYTLPEPAVLAGGPVLHNGASALAAFLAQTSAQGHCIMNLAYFDGRTRADMASTFEGLATDSPALADLRDGPVQRCRLTEKAPAEAAGFEDKLITDDSDSLALQVAHVNGRAVPVAAELEIGAGTVAARLTQFELSVAGELVAQAP